MLTIYLAGNINGLTYSQATGWREDYEDFLYQHGYRTLNPLRGTNYMKKILNKNEKIDDCDERIVKIPHTIILERDLLDIELSEVILANMEHTNKKPSYGLLVELGYALARQKSVIIMNAPDLVRMHPFFSEFYFVNKQEDLLNILIELQENLVWVGDDNPEPEDFMGIDLN